MKAELLSARLPLAELGEGPCWDTENGYLYWVDITGQRIHRYDHACQKHEVCTTPSMVGFAVTRTDGGLVAGFRDGVYAFDFTSGAARKIAAPAGMPPDNRFNDGKCDRRGRLWCGTMNVDPGHPKPTGSLYRLDGESLTQIERDVFISNGLGWSPDNRTMYYTDTIHQTTWRYEYDIETGTAANRRVFLKTDLLDGGPDGLCVDSQGRVLTALWAGWGIEIRTPDGKLDGRIGVPVPQVSSCAFGGPDFKTLFITTAKIGMEAAALAEAPLSGAVFAIEMDVPGLPEVPCRGDAP
jgi:sugar lactone lactonase YvrE